MLALSSGCTVISLRPAQRTTTGCDDLLCTVNSICRNAGTEICGGVIFRSGLIVNSAGTRIASSSPAPPGWSSGLVGVGVGDGCVVAVGAGVPDAVALGVGGGVSVALGGGARGAGGAFRSAPPPPGPGGG